MISRLMTLSAAALSLISCAQRSSGLDLYSVPDATALSVSRVEPLSWWTGMKMPLQLLIQGERISACSVRIEGGKGVSVKEIHKADSPNYLFVDVEIAPDALAGTYYLVFTGKDRMFKYPYVIAPRGEGSSSRSSFTTADMIYLVFPDRFADGDPSIDATDDTVEGVDREENFGRHGGDLQGIIDHLDYISELGATAIWSTPLLLDDQPQGSYHGYACGDYYHIDPRMGTNELYRDFVGKAHEKGMKVIMDVVTNHCGTAHWWMKDLPFEDWIHQFTQYTPSNHAFSTNMDPNASKYDLYQQESGWFVPEMPDMNLDNPYMLRYFEQWALWWIEYSGLDGFRVDTYPYNEKVAMSQWCAAVRRDFPNFNIVGECWTASHAQLAYWQGDNANADGFNSNLPSIMDFPLCDAITQALGESGSEPAWGSGMFKVYNSLSHDFLYHDLSKMLIFLANHDHSRLGDVWEHDPAKMKIGLALLATLRGIPQLYNGDEMMFSARAGEMNDGSKRIDFPGGWAGDKVNLFTAEGRAEAARKPRKTLGSKLSGLLGGKSDAAPDYSFAEELHDYTARLFNWRKGCKVIHEGKTMHFLSRDNTYAFFRYTDTGKVFVFVNNTDSEAAVPWEHYDEISPGRRCAINVLTGERVFLQPGLTVPAMSALIAEF